VRKSQITRIPPNTPLRDQAWMDLDRIASIEVSSEENNYPIESALLVEGKEGWRAANHRIQKIRLIFDEPQKIRRILLVCEDTKTPGLKNLSSAGHPISRVIFAKLSASKGILARFARYVRQKTMRLNYPKPKYLN
jgi:hypothetical protein